MHGPVGILYLFKKFLLIGLYSFGGYTALIAVIKKEMVDRDNVLDEHVVLDGLSIATILPGPLAVNIVTYIGFTLRGWLGAMVSMFAVLIPSCLFMILLAELSDRFSEISIISTFLGGVIAVIVAVILRVAFQMRKNHVKQVWQYALSIGVLVGSFFYSGYLTVLFMIGLGAIIGSIAPIGIEKDSDTEHVGIGSSAKLFPWLIIVLLIFGSFFFLFNDESKTILVVFSKVSLTLFGGGYVMIPSLFDLVVEQHRWLTGSEFSRAIAFGQMTPGPILVSSTYVGYQVNGVTGALLATIGIFLPSAILMVIVGAGFIQIKELTIVKRIMNGIRPVVVGLIGYSVFIIVDGSELPITTIVFATVAYFLLTFAKFNFFLVILLSALTGLFFF